MSHLLLLDPAELDAIRLAITTARGVIQRQLRSVLSERLTALDNGKPLPPSYKGAVQDDLIRKIDRLDNLSFKLDRLAGEDVPPSIGHDAA